MKASVLIHSVILLIGVMEVCTAGDARKFDDLFCRLVLPGDTWKWEDKTGLPSEVVAFASSRDGTMLMFAAKRAPRGHSINRETISGFDQGFIVEGITKKRRGRIIKFKGLRCYQLCGSLIPQNRTTVIRCFVRNRIWYQLQVVGAGKPVENRPDIESIFGAFEFTGAPKRPLFETEYDFSRTMGKVAFWCVAVAIVIYLLRKARRRPRKEAGSSERGTQGHA